MKFDISLPPAEFFFVPGRDPGLSYVEAPEWVMRRVPGARVRQIAASDYPEVQQRIERRLDPRWNTPEKNATFEFSTVPVVLEQAGHRGSYASAGGKWILNAAAGDRVIEKYLASNPDAGAERQVNRLFAEAREAGPAAVPVWSKPVSGLDVVIECRNQHNFYHFLSEALGKLSHFTEMPHKPRITFQCRKGEVRGFLMRFIETLYPELAGRVAFVDGQIASEQVLAPYNHRHYLYQVADPRTEAEVAAVAATDEWWTRIGAHRPRRKFVSKNSFDSSLRALRERGLSRLSLKAVAALPRRIIVSRDPDRGARDRGMEGADAMVAALKSYGFVEVFFERMSPLEQIAAMQAADIMISGHGAGFANMVFSRPGAHVIEIGTAQTQAHRWGDFLPNAHVSGCSYTTIFGDISGAAPGTVPAMTEGHRGIRIGRRALDAIIEQVEAAG